MCYGFADWRDATLTTPTIGKVVWPLLIVSLFPVVSMGQDCTQTIPIDVLDGDTGASIVPLTAEALRARTGGTALPVIALNRILTSRIIVLIDESGSMGGSSESPEMHLDQVLRPIKQTLSELMEDLPPGVSIEYGLFNDKWLFSDGFVSDPNELRRRVEDVTSRFGKMGYGKTALYDSLHEALLNFGTPQLTDTILLLTDGGDNSSQRSAKQLEHEFRVAGVRLLTMIVYLSQVHGALSPSEVDQRDSVQALVSNTGGSSFAVDGASRYWIDKKTSAAYVQLVRYFWQHQVLDRYIAYVQVPAALRNEQKWKLWLNSDADPRLKHGVVVYPNRLSPCPVATRSPS